MNHETSFPFTYSIHDKGKHSTILDCGIWNDHPIIVKVPRYEQYEWTMECLIQCHVLHHLISQGIPNLVETYTLLHCPSPIRKHSGLLHDSTPPVPMLVQRHIKGKSLHFYVMEQCYSWSHVTNWLIQLFTLLLWLEASPYQLYHNDLHLGNIMIEDETDTVYLVDFGCAECTIDTNRRTQSLPDKYKYCGSRHHASSLLSGASDMYMILQQLSHSPCPEVAEIALVKCKALLNHFDVSDVNPSIWLYTLLDKEESKRSGHEKETLHSYHMTVLSTMTYSYCIQTFFPELVAWKDVITTIEQFPWETPFFMK